MLERGVPSGVVGIPLVAKPKPAIDIGAIYAARRGSPNSKPTTSSSRISNKTRIDYKKIYESRKGATQC